MKISNTCYSIFGTVIARITEQSCVVRSKIKYSTQLKPNKLLSFSYLCDHKTIERTAELPECDSDLLSIPTTAATEKIIYQNL